MSIRVMSAIWQEAEADGSTLLILLALADFANDDGVCWPSMGKLADKARVSESRAHQILRQLRQRGIVTIEEGAGPKGVNVYTINQRGAIVAPLEPTAPQVQSSLGGAIQDKGGVQPIAPDPSSDPSVLKKKIKTKEKELDELAKSFATFGAITAGTAQALEWSVEEFGLEWVKRAIHDAASRGFKDAPPWSYVESILEDWKQNGGLENGNRSRASRRKPAAAEDTDRLADGVSGVEQRLAAQSLARRRRVAG